MFLITGLGNPGLKYKKNRHNVGFLTVDFWLTRHFSGGSKGKIISRLESWVLKQNNIIFAKPQTFMNNSGQAVKK